jgi:hypothetical protein
MLVTKSNDRVAGCRLLAWACATALTVSGCGSGKIPVKGSVLFAGKPVEEGMITFEPGDGKGPTTGGLIAEGKYELEGEAGALPGEKIVRIVALRKTGRMIPAGSPAPPGTMVAEVIQCVPSRYNDHSALRVQITPGRANTHDFDLKPDGASH